METRLSGFLNGGLFWILIVLLLAMPVSAANPAELTAGNTGAFPWSVSGIVPGTSGSTLYELRNSGTQAGTLYIWVSDIREVDRYGPGTALQNYMYFNVSHPRLQSSAALPAHISAFPAAPLGTDYIVVPGFSPGETLKLRWTWEFRETGTPQNEAQNASLWFNITYTLVTVPPPTTRPTIQPPGGGGDGGDGGSGSETHLPTAVPTIIRTGTERPVIPVTLQPPRCYNVSLNYTPGFEGLFYNADNAGTLDLNLSKVRTGKTNVTLFPDHIDVYHNETAGVLLRFWVDTTDIRNATRIVKKVNSAELWTDPLAGTLSSGTYIGSVHAIPTLITPTSLLRVTLSDCIIPEITDTIRDTCAQNNRGLGTIPYGMDVELFNLTGLGEANVSMTLPVSWVDRQGVNNPVYIARIGDGTGTAHLLDTIALGSDSQGNLLFQGSSQRGASLYAIFSCTPLVSPSQEPDQGTPPAVSGVFADTFYILFILIILLLLLIAIAVYYLWLRKKES